MSTPKNKKNKAELLVAYNRVGWEAIQHNDGWWVGTEKGVTCYGDHELARLALTIIWQRDGGKLLNFKIAKYTQVADKNVAPDYTPEYNAVEALAKYERTPNRPKRVKK